MNSTPAKSKSYDCIIIGGGHNGLVAAAYLAKAGKSCACWNGATFWRLCDPEELWPGYKVSVAAYVISLFLPEIIRDLRLPHYGLKILPRNPSSFTPLLDGRYLMLGPDSRMNWREIAKFSQRDAEAYPKYNSLLERIAPALEPVLAKSAPDPLPLPKSAAKSAWPNVSVTPEKSGSCIRVISAGRRPARGDRNLDRSCPADLGAMV